jgi:hypothetical protein
VLLFAGCATVPKEYPRTASTAFEDHESTGIGREVAALAAQHPGDSGFAIQHNTPIRVALRVPPRCTLPFV